MDDDDDAQPLAIPMDDIPMEDLNDVDLDHVDLDEEMLFGKGPAPPPQSQEIPQHPTSGFAWDDMFGAIGGHEIDLPPELEGLKLPTDFESAEETIRNLEQSLVQQEVIIQEEEEFSDGLLAYLDERLTETIINTGQEQLLAPLPQVIAVEAPQEIAVEAPQEQDFVDLEFSAQPTLMTPELQQIHFIKLYGKAVTKTDLKNYLRIAGPNLTPFLNQIEAHDMMNPVLDLHVPDNNFRNVPFVLGTDDRPELRIRYKAATRHLGFGVGQEINIWHGWEETQFGDKLHIVIDHR